MKIEIGCSCILLDEDWLDLKTYRVVSIDGEDVEIIRLSDYLQSSAGIFVKRDKLFASPFSLLAPHNSNEYENSRFIVNLAQSFFRVDRRIEAETLVDKIKAHPRLENFPVENIRSYLKCLVANKYLESWIDERSNNGKVYIEASQNAIAAENQRKFSGTLGSELYALSERIRLLISHTGSVGTYRENLLRGLLKRSLPERYHVATGFIYGCSRQVDIIIYDRIDYSPIFREDDLVVVPAASVRAVIEVKTNLTKSELKKSIFLIDELSHLDTDFPPIFKGIFAFESKISKKILDEALSIYRYDSVPCGDFENQITITDPHQHITSICVLNKVVGHVYYKRDAKTQHFTPRLYAHSSATNLNSQAAFFLDSLLSHLKTTTLKEDSQNRILIELGADSIFTNIGSLTDTSWGPYFRAEVGMGDDDDEVERMEADIERYNEWMRFHIGSLP